MPSTEYMREYMRSRRERRRASLIETLGGKCVVCGATGALEIDHIDPDSKSFTLSGCSLDKAWPKVLAEAAKCQLLCKDHHLEKTVEWAGRRLHHGSQTMYSKYRCRCDICKGGYAKARKKHPSRQRRTAISQGSYLWK